MVYANARMLGRRIGQYRIVRKVGEGGMGVVYEAVHEKLKLRAAVKVLFVACAKDSAEAARFFAEARATSAVQHSSLVRLFDFGHLDDGTIYMMMEYLDGETLRDHLVHSGGKLPTTQALIIIEQMAAVLSAVHAAGIIHRDLKPSNVMLTPDKEVVGQRRVKLLDFGVAKFLDEQVSQTKSGHVVGTPRYMSPEQCAAMALDTHTDVYSLGLILFEVLTGESPYEPGVSDRQALMHAHIFEKPRSLRQLLTDASRELTALMADMLSKDPAMRPSMAEVAEKLASLRSKQVIAQSPSTALAGVAETPPSPTTQHEALATDTGASSPALLKAAPRRALGTGATSMAANDDFVVPPLFDEYRLIHSIGRGAMGEVFLCHDTKLDRQVAVKFIRHLGADSAARRRFDTEARAIARLEAHSNVVAVYRLGEWAGQPYLVSQFISGQSLDRLPKPIQWQDVLRIGIGLARGLAAAHKNRILHCDIKPANIMLSADQEIKLLDFGLAKLLDSGPQGTESEPGSRRVLKANDLFATQPELAAKAPPADGAIVAGRPVQSERSGTGIQPGTPLYMSPELWLGEPATARSDIYSLGAVLYELIIGAPPHNRDTISALKYAVQHEEVPPIRGIVPAVDTRFCDAIERCLHRDPAQRYSETLELLAELEAIAGGTLGNVSLPPKFSLRRRMAIAGGGLVAASLVLGTGWKIWQHPPEMITIAGGTFMMGSTAKEIESAWEWCTLEDKTGCKRELYEREQPVHEVAVSSFRIDRTEVTQAAYTAWLNSQKGLRLEDSIWVKDGDVVLIDIYPTFSPSQGVVYDEQHGKYRVLAGYEQAPVVQVTWDGAQRYCQSHGKRLPTEAEWEYAARGLSQRRFPWGNDEPKCDGVVISRSAGLPCATANPGPRAVGSSSQDRTPEGVLDMGGNVGEWVADYFTARYLSCKPACMNPQVGTLVETGRAGVALRAYRGGNWNAGASVSRAASRSRWEQNEGVTNLGFRCAASILKYRS